MWRSSLDNLEKKNMSDGLSKKAIIFWWLDDFAKPRSSLTSSHIMKASQSVQKAMFWQSVRQKGLDGTRRSIDHTD